MLKSNTKIQYDFYKVISRIIFWQCDMIIHVIKLHFFKNNSCTFLNIFCKVYYLTLQCIKEEENTVCQNLFIFSGNQLHLINIYFEYTWMFLLENKTKY